MGKLYEENWYQNMQKNNKSGQIFKVVPVQVQGCTDTPPAEAKLYRYRSKLYRYSPTECNLYRYRSELYRYRCAQNAQIVVILHI